MRHYAENPFLTAGPLCATFLIEEMTDRCHSSATFEGEAAQTLCACALGVLQ